MWLPSLLQVTEHMQLRSIVSTKGTLGKKKTQKGNSSMSWKSEARLPSTWTGPGLQPLCQDRWICAWIHGDRVVVSYKCVWLLRKLGVPKALLSSLCICPRIFAGTKAKETMACLTGKHKCELLHVQRIACASKNVMQNEEHVAMTGGSSDWRSHIQTHH